MKFKQINPEYFITILDRLTRFEPAYIRYNRVFEDIINKFSNIKAKNLTIEDKIALCEEIINFSTCKNNNTYINNVLRTLEEKYFNFNPVSYQYLSSRINFEGLIGQIQKTNNLPKNVIWLKEIFNRKNDLKTLRDEFSLQYPIEKIILCEGQTEYVLLETIFKKFGYDINKKGILILPAGGKNQVARKYYSMIEYTKLPFFILLDKDAISIKELIKPKLRSIDDIYLIESGEFEDLIPKNILQNTINTIHSSEINCIFDDFDNENSMVVNLENIYKKYGFGEFKKAKFAQKLKEYIEKNCKKDMLINSEIVEILKRLN